MPGIYLEVIVHHLKVDSAARPVKQKLHRINKERSLALRAEVSRLLKAGSIRECHYPEWLDNPVLVKKKTSKWRVCIDFTNLNAACPKDDHPLPRIDQLVEATAGHDLLSFMNAYSGYNQIRMHPPYEDKTRFITDSAVYCYKMMPFGLKNAGETFQR